MEISVLKALLNSISHFFHLSTSAAVKHEPVEKYYQKIDENLKLLEPVLDVLVDSEVALDEQLNKALEDLDAIVNAAQELIENWHRLTSKICFVLQVEPLIIKIQACRTEICSQVDMLLKSLPDVLSSTCAQHCTPKIEQIGTERMSDVIKEAIRDQVDNAIHNSECLAKFSQTLSLNSNQELLLEAVALERVKANADQDDNMEDRDYIDQMIALVTHMHECLMKVKQSETVYGVPIPADFCCPLSLELMSDPVMVASGQTYERAFIRKWLDQGLTVCPKTRQTLSHTNLIPNYTVKAFIANWCESNNIKLPDPVKSVALNQPSALLPTPDSSPGNSHILSHVSWTHRSRSPEPERSVGSNMSFSSSNGTHLQDRHCSPPHLTSSRGQNGFEADIARVTLQSSEDMEVNSEAQNSGLVGQTSSSSKRESSKSSLTEEQVMGHIRSDSVSSAVSSVDINEPSHVSGELTHCSSDVSGELTSETPPSTASSREPEFFPRSVETTRSRSQNMWRRPSERLVPRIVSSSSLDSRPDLSGVETQVKKLVEGLQSSSPDVRREAAAELRLLAKHSMDNRIVIASCGAISHLVSLLHSPDLKTQENAVTALLNLSINDNNKTAIANAGAIDPLIHVLETGNPEAKENSAATLFSLSVMEENKVKIGRSGAIRPLVDLLGNGTPRGKKDAATALFNLSIYHENKARIVHAGAVKHLVELMDPAAGMVDKAVAVLANLATIPEGRSAIGQEGGIPVLVEVVELGSSRGKEHAAAALLQLSRNSNRFCSVVLQEGAVPPLVALSQSGTPRAKEKAQALLNYFRNQRHGNAGRA
ncbi:U-box domain-containing protein 4-like [Aristolochia californica]|uniref:U-box domain-containing protein 4-like n=1 Tax=Aristolochia californica TaxID=171875 RepID=UPI0035DA8776